MAYLDITTQVVLYPVPCVQVTVFDSLADWSGGLGLPPTTAGVVRVNADGTTEQVRSAAVTNGDGRSVWTDYECPQQEQVTYKAMVSRMEAPAPSSGPVTVPDVGAWLIDPANPAGSIPIAVQDTGFGGWSRASTVSVVPISGSALPYVVESSVRQAPTGDLSIWVLDSGMHDALMAILNSPGAKLFSWPRRFWPGYGQLSWAFVTTATDTPSTPVQVAWVAQLSLQPSARPAVVAQSQGRTWDDILELGWTWQDILDMGLTWDDL